MRHVGADDDGPLGAAPKRFDDVGDAAPARAADDERDHASFARDGQEERQLELDRMLMVSLTAARSAAGDAG